MICSFSFFLTINPFLRILCILLHVYSYYYMSYSHTLCNYYLKFIINIIIVVLRSYIAGLRDQVIEYKVAAERAADPDDDPHAHYHGHEKCTAGESILYIKKFISVTCILVHMICSRHTPNISNCNANTS